MGFILVIALAVGAIAFVLMAFAGFTFGLASLRHLFRRRYSLAKRYLVLEAVALACLCACVFVIRTQPVEWPWSPWHVPIYVLAIWVCKALLAKGKLLEQEQAAVSPGSKVHK